MDSTRYGFRRVIYGLAVTHTWESLLHSNFTKLFLKAHISSLVKRIYHPHLFTAFKDEKVEKIVKCVENIVTWFNTSCIANYERKKVEDLYV